MKNQERPLPIWAYLSALLLAVVMLAACSSGDDAAVGPDGSDEGKAIYFSSEMGIPLQQNAGTRAATLEEKATTFKVYGYKNTGYDVLSDSYTGLQTVFDGYTVTYTEASAGSTDSNQFDWEYVKDDTQTIHYWDFSGKAYRFGAYAPATAAVTTSTTGEGLTLSIPADAYSEASMAATPYYARMWFSNNNYPDYPAFGEPVVLTFLQPFCKVRIRFLDSDSNEVTTSSVIFMKTTSGSIAFKPTDSNRSMGRKGTVNITYPLMGTEKAERVTSTIGPAKTDSLSAITEPYEESVAFASTPQRWYPLLPMGQQGAYTLSLIYNGESRTTVVPAEYMTWLPGYEYTYVFKFSEESVSFVASLFVYTKWQSGYSETVDW